MKIAIVWAHGVGKTTISKVLSDQMNIPVILDIVPEAYRLWFEINENTPIETQIWLTAKQLELERNTEHFVADKCLIDYFVYGDVLLDDSDVKVTIKKIVDRNSVYDHIFYIPIEFALVDDGLRSMNPEFQKAIDTRYKQYLDESGIQYHTITWSIEERLSQICWKIWS